mmetsp:Transcript_22283/g.47395  ORF Transcript_22283/g.47395 Transcript_22283/m.47395 type:complete len:274 (+) Transcript_22283:437-1258(+)
MFLGKDIAEGLSMLKEQVRVGPSEAAGPTRCIWRTAHVHPIEQATIEVAMLVLPEKSIVGLQIPMAHAYVAAVAAFIGLHILPQWSHVQEILQHLRQLLGVLGILREEHWSDRRRKLDALLGEGLAQALRSIGPRFIQRRSLRNLLGLNELLLRVVGLGSEDHVEDAAAVPSCHACHGPEELRVDGLRILQEEILVLLADGHDLVRLFFEVLQYLSSLLVHSLFAEQHLLVDANEFSGLSANVCEIHFRDAEWKDVLARDVDPQLATIKIATC